MTNRVLPIALAALTLLAACSTFRQGAAPGRAELLSEALAPPDRACRPSPRPQALPAVSALVDSAALAAAAAEVWQGARGTEGYVLLALRYDPEGTNVRRDVIEQRVVPRTVADTLQRLVFAHRRRTGPAEREWAVRLRVDLGPQPAVRVGRSEICAARPQDQTDARYAGLSAPVFGDVRDRTAPAALTGGDGVAWVRVELDRGGNVVNARLERTFAGIARQRQALQRARMMRFFPATEDGEPVASHLTFAMRVYP